jgi:hypothetical protein
VIALSVGIIWAGYTVGLYGYVLLKGYNVTLAELVNPVHIYSSSLASAGQIPASQILPSGTSSGSTPASFTSETGSTATTGQSSSISSTGGVRQTGTAPQS